LPGDSRDTPAKNIAYLNRAVFGHEGFLREIISFIPRVRFEVGEGEEDEEKELLRAELWYLEVDIRNANDRLRQAQEEVEQAQAKAAELQKRLDDLELTHAFQRIADSERGFPAKCAKEG